MLSVDELTSQYDSYTDEELYQVLIQIEGYSAEAKQALVTVIQKRGGDDELMQRMEQKAIKEKERNRIIAEVDELGKKGVDKSFISTTIQSDVLTRQELDELIDHGYHQLTLDIADKKIKTRTIIGGITGTIIASIIGSFVCGMLLTWAPERLPLIVIGLLFIGLFLGCGMVIKLCTGQSYKNIVVISATFIAMILSIGLGEPVFQWVLRMTLNGR